MSARPDIVIDAPFGKLHVTDNDVSDHAIMRARQLAMLLDLMTPDNEGPGTALWLAQQLADEVVAAIAGMMGVKP